MNGEGAVHVDRGRWLYRFVLDSNNVAIYRGHRLGQGLASPEVWRQVASLGVSDVLVVEVSGGWQPFVEVDDGRQHWALARRESADGARRAAEHFLRTLASAVASAAQFWASAATNEFTLGTSFDGFTAGALAHEEDASIAECLVKAKQERDAKGWELVYRRERVPKTV